MLRLKKLVWEAILPVLLVLSSAAAGAQVSEPPRMASPVLVQTTWEARAFLGVGVAEVDSQRAKALNLKEEYGVEITRVDENSPAEQAGLKAGDVILAYNGQRVEGADQFIRLVRETPPGRTVKLTIVRGGAQQIVSATLGTRKPQLFAPDMQEFQFELPEVNIPMLDVPRAEMFWRSSMLGVEAESLGETQLAAYFGVKDGVLVRSVFKGSAAEKAGLKAGDVLLKVDKDTVTTPREVTGAMRNSRKNGRKTFPVVLMRDHKEMTLMVMIEDPHPPAVRPLGSPVKHQSL
jgi:serine protease Do